MSNTKLPTLPPLPGKGKAKAPQKCACGCAELTKGGRFLPGHDAIRLAWAIRVERGIVEEAPAPHTAAVAAFVKERAAERQRKEAKRSA